MLSHARHTAGASVLWRARLEGMDPNSSGDCFERGCGAELPNGAKLAVLHALYQRGAWPPPTTYCRLADVHRPMVRELFGGEGHGPGSEAQLKASDPGWRESCAPP